MTATDDFDLGGDRPSRSPRFIAPEIEPAPSRRARWRGLLGSSLTPDSFISAEESARAPMIAAYARRNILTEVYGRDIHGDVIDIDAVAQRVSSRRERIFFWGEPSSVAALRAAFSTARYGSIDLSAIGHEAGTATLALASDFFGDGAWELSRTGSTSAKADATPAHIAMLHEYLERDCGPEIVFAITRTEARHASVPGGIAIHRLHVRALRSIFLGVWPSWLELLPGEMQLYDFRAIFRDPEAVLERVRRAPTPVFASADAAEFANAVIALSNIGVPQAKVWRQGHGGGGLKFTARCVRGFGDWVKQRIYISSKAHGGCPLDAMPSEHWDGSSCITVRMPLVAESVSVQDWLERKGFRFCALDPPRDPASWFGYWCRPCAKMNFSPPYYLLRALPSMEEAALARTISKIMTEWTNWSRAGHV
jgi:hypothetical protein